MEFKILLITIFVNIQFNNAKSKWDILPSRLSINHKGELLGDFRKNIELHLEGDIHNTKSPWERKDDTITAGNKKQPNYGVDYDSTSEYGYDYYTKYAEFSTASYNDYNKHEGQNSYNQLNKMEGNKKSQIINHANYIPTQKNYPIDGHELSDKISQSHTPKYTSLNTDQSEHFNNQGSLQRIANLMKGVGSTIKNTGSNLGYTIGKTLGGIGGTAISTSSNLGYTIGKTLGGIGDTVISTSSNLGYTIGETLEGLADTVKNTGSKPRYTIDKTVNSINFNTHLPNSNTPGKTLEGVRDSLKSTDINFGFTSGKPAKELGDTVKNIGSNPGYTISKTVDAMNFNKHLFNSGFSDWKNKNHANIEIHDESDHFLGYDGALDHIKLSGNYEIDNDNSVSDNSDHVYLTHGNPVHEDVNSHEIPHSQNTLNPGESEEKHLFNLEGDVDVNTHLHKDKENYLHRNKNDYQNGFDIGNNLYNNHLRKNDFNNNYEKYFVNNKQPIGYQRRYHQNYY